MTDFTTSFATHGWAHVPQVLTPPEVYHLRAAMFRAAIAKKGQLQWRYVDGQPFPALLFWPALVEPYMDYVRLLPAVQRIVQALLGNQVKQLNNQIYYRLPGDTDAFAWHSDYIFRRRMSAGADLARQYVQTVLCVDDWTPDNGGLYFHPAYDGPLAGEDFDQLRAAPDVTGATFVPAQAGDMVLWNAKVPHASQPNISQHPRMTYMNGFAAAAACEEGAWPWYIMDGQLHPDIDPRRL